MTQVKKLFFATILYIASIDPGFFFHPPFSTTKKEQQKIHESGHFNYKSLTGINSRDILENQPNTHLNLFGHFGQEFFTKLPFWGDLTSL